MRERTHRLTLSLIVGLSLTLPACRQSAVNVQATLEDFRITLEPASVPAGEATIAITNGGAAASQSVHELVLLRTDLSPGELPPMPSGAVDQTSPGISVIDEAENIPPGGGATLQVDLDRGSYLAICNIPGHFGQGMFAPLTVR